MLEPENTAVRVRQITWAGIWVNLALTIAKILAGVFGHSRALIADGVESGMDILTSAALLVGSRYWSAPPDADHPYGHKRIETLLTLGIGLVVGLVGLSILWNALASLHEGEHAQPTPIALVVAVGTVIAKEILYRWSDREGRKIRSMSVVANAWHHRADAISSIPVVLSVAATQVFPNLTFLDAVGAMIASGFILKASFEILWPALREIADTGVTTDTVNKLQAIASSVDGVRSLHDIRTRYVGGSSIQIDLHVVVDPDITVMESHRIGDAVAARLKAEGPDVLDVLVHIDPSPDM